MWCVWVPISSSDKEPSEQTPKAYPSLVFSTQKKKLCFFLILSLLLI